MACPIPKWLFAVALSAGCGSQTGLSVADITFDPNPSAVAGGVCSSEGTLIATSGGDTVLVSLSATFEDARGESAEFAWDGEELEAAADTVVVPSLGAAVIEMDFDLDARGLVPPAQGLVVVVGAGAGGTTQFTGVLECE